MDPIEPAPLQFQDGAPISPAYGDVYFSREDGLAESRYVFLEGNGLPARWLNRNRFTIGETGFGTGLNFLLTLQAFRRHAPAHARLHYVSVEKHPFTRSDLERLLAGWPELAVEAGALLAAWPPPVAGLHRRELFDGRVVLHLLLGDATAMLTELDATVDAWYLDGFAPSRNPQMWQPALFAQIARLSRPGATFATFTAAGDVRRALAAAGFTVHKRPGFGRKREMLTGHIDRPPRPADTAPWYRRPEPATGDRQAIVVGAGLAGAAAAFELAERDWAVTVLERGEEVAGGASGNPAGVLMPRLNAVMDTGARFHLHAFLRSLARLAELRERGIDTGFQATGVLQLDRNARHTGRIHPALPAIVVEAVDPETAGRLAGTPLPGPALHYPGGGWLSPPHMCRQLLGHANVTVATGRPVAAIHWRNDHWQVQTPAETFTAPVVILANGAAAETLATDLHWHLQSVRGQISFLSAPRESWPRLPVVGDGYATPTNEDFLVIGATFDPRHTDPGLRETDHAANLRTLEQSLPALAGHPVTGGRTGFRTGSPDRLPLAGPVPDGDRFREAYADLRHGPLRRRLPPACYLPGLHVTTAHGARGLTTCLPVAGLIAAHLDDEPLPFLRNERHAIHPARFLIRHLKRNRD